MTPQRTPPKEGPMQKRRLCRHTGKHIIKAITAIATLGLVFYLIWNWTTVPLFTFPPLTYLQALGAVLVTGSLLFIGRHTVGRCHQGRTNDPMPGGCRFSGPRPEASSDA